MFTEACASQFFDDGFIKASKHPTWVHTYILIATWALQSMGTTYGDGSDIATVSMRSTRAVCQHCGA